LDFYAYLLRCADGSYYAGHTDDLDTRFAQHQAGESPGYTQSRRPVELVWSDRFPDRDSAFAAEQQIKGWSRAKKEALIRGDWEAISALAKKPGVLRYEASTSSASTQDERVGRATDPLILNSELSVGESRVLKHRTKAPAIILVRPQLGENIGKAARAMLNFGLTDLRLVAPRDGWPNPAAGPAASGADMVLERARVFESVAEAVADCAHVYATTVRKRDLVLPVVTPEQAAREMRGQAGGSAVLFGAERSGLETDEAAIAGKILTVPINPEFGSLNLAQAVILVAYEWSKGEALAMPTAVDEAEPRASHDQLEGLIGQLDRALEEAGYFFPPDRAPATRRTIRTILTKAGWSNREVQALRGMIGAITRPRRR
jgi:tRNA/rRNA methyltransferase